MYYAHEAQCGMNMLFRVLHAEMYAHGVQNEEMVKPFPGTIFPVNEQAPRCFALYETHVSYIRGLILKP